MYKRCSLQSLITLDLINGESLCEAPLNITMVFQAGIQQGLYPLVRDYCACVCMCAERGVLWTCMLACLDNTEVLIQCKNFILSPFFFTATRDENKTKKKINLESG